jgi:SAM-dependent methyltransferase
MKLSTLVNYRNQLDSMSADPIGQVADKEIEKITYLAQNQNIQIAEFAQQLQQRRNDIQQSFNLFENDLTALKQELGHLIDATEKPWFAESYRLYEQEMVNETNEYILNRRPDIAPETEQFYRTRIVRYNSWQHPAMIIRPGRETYINELLASDPLYLVDENHDLLMPAMSLFNEQYQNRLRSYNINERQDQEILGKLPNGQFGLVFAYNFFNFRPFEVLKKYLDEIYQKLRPGGVLAMTFNDCDRDKGVILVEQHFCCYTPGYLVRELAQRLGYEVAFSWNDGGPTTWLELQKPGEFTSLRGGQALAKIVSK